MGTCKVPIENILENNIYSSGAVLCGFWKLDGRYLFDEDPHTATWNAGGVCRSEKNVREADEVTVIGLWAQ